METFYFLVKVEAETDLLASEAMGERLGPDEDYGFEYTVNWRPIRKPNGGLKPRHVGPETSANKISTL